MKRIGLLVISSFVLVLVAADTTSNAHVLCTVENNGESCTLQGSCIGNDYFCRYYPEHCPEDPLREDTPQLRGEWQLVSVQVHRVTTRESGKLRS